MEILNFVKKHCEENNIVFKPIDAEEINYHNSIEICIGYFIDKNGYKELSVGLQAELWRETLLHEFCHSQQAAESNKLWLDTFLTDEQLVWLSEYGFSKGDDIVDVFHAWTEHKFELPANILLDFSTRVILMELDCEKRTIELCKKMMSETFDEKSYNQQVNAYLRSYRYGIYAREWGDCSETYQNFSDKLDLDYLAPISAQEIEWFKTKE
mgnify:CR=1 FL=1